MIEEMTQARYWETTPVIYSQISDVFWHQDSTMISNHALEHIVQQIENVKTVIGLPMEAEKANVAATEFHHWFDQLPELSTAFGVDLFAILLKLDVPSIRMHARSRFLLQRAIPTKPSSCQFIRIPRPQA
jgi:hypothetical protein